MLTNKRVSPAKDRAIRAGIKADPALAGDVEFVSLDGPGTTTYGWFLADCEGRPAAAKAYRRDIRAMLDAEGIAYQTITGD